MTEMQKQMAAAVGHKVEIHLANGYVPCVGTCTDFVQPEDNDPPVASILLKTPQYDGYTEIIEDEIVSIEIKD